MAILRDINNNKTYVEYKVIDHYLDDMEGSQLSFKYVQNDEIIYEVNFGWTNRTVHSFISMLKQFPIKEYEGYFSHFEKHLEIKWDRIDGLNHYNIHFIENDTPTVITAKQEDLIAWGMSFGKAWEESPVIK